MTLDEYSTEIMRWDIATITMWCELIGVSRETLFRTDLSMPLAIEYNALPEYVRAMDQQAFRVFLRLRGAKERNYDIR